MDTKMDANHSTTILPTDADRISELETDRMMLDRALVKAMAHLIQVRNGTLSGDEEARRYHELQQMAWDARAFSRMDARTTPTDMGTDELAR